MPTNKLVTQFNLASNTRLTTDIIPIVQTADLGTGTATYTPLSALNILYWSTLGNAGTTAGTNFIGTTDNTDFVIKANSVEGIRLKSGGHVGIGQPSPTVLLHVGSGPALSTELQTVSKNQNALTASTVVNQTSGNVAQSAFLVTSDSANIGLYANSTLFTPSGMQLALSSVLITYGGSFQIGTADSNPMRFYTNLVEAGRISPTGNWGIGQITPATLLHIGPGSISSNNELVSVTNNQNYNTYLSVNNTTTGIRSQAGYAIQSDSAAAIFISLSSSFTPSLPVQVAGQTTLQALTGLNITGGAGPTNIWSTPNVKRVTFDTNGNSIFNATGSALATTTQVGFVYLPNCAGTPTLPPTVLPTGATPVIIDTTGGKLWAYYGATWHFVALT